MLSHFSDALDFDLVAGSADGWAGPLSRCCFGVAGPEAEAGHGLCSPGGGAHLWASGSQALLDCPSMAPRRPPKSQARLRGVGGMPKVTYTHPVGRWRVGAGVPSL